MVIAFVVYVALSAVIAAVVGMTAYSRHTNRCWQLSSEVKKYHDTMSDIKTLIRIADERGTGLSSSDMELILIMIDRIDHPADMWYHYIA